MKKVIAGSMMGLLTLALLLVPTDLFAVPTSAAMSGSYTYSVSGGKATITDVTATAMVIVEGASQNGWVQTAGKWYFYENGAMVKSAGVRIPSVGCI